MRRGPVLSSDVALRAMAAKTKPLGALGRLEDVGVRLAMLQRSLAPRADRARVCVFAADHGVADEGVSAYPKAVTGEMMRNFDRGGAAINVIAVANAIEVEVIDVGVDADLSELTRVRRGRVRAGSRNFTCEPAMTGTELEAAFVVGAEAARRADADGVHVLGLGEMGIGNTTAASAVLSTLTGRETVETVGRGTGVNDSVLAHKRTVIDAAMRLHWRDHGQPVTGRDALRCVGGLELAAIAGAAREAAELGIAVVVDGFISTVAVLAALHVAREEGAAHTALAASVFFAHRSAERAHTLAIDACAAFEGCDPLPLLDLGMRLGEGSGAALAIPILRAAAAVMRDMATFADAGVSAGELADAHATSAAGAPPG